MTACVAAICLTVALQVARRIAFWADGTQNRMLPSPGDHHLDTVAYLSGGARRLVYTSLFRLGDRGLLTAESARADRLETNGDTSEKPEAVDGWSDVPLTVLDHEILAFLGGKAVTSSQDISAIEEHVRPHTDAIERQMQAGGLLHEDMRNNRRMRSITMSIRAMYVVSSITCLLDALLGAIVLLFMTNLNLLPDYPHLTSFGRNYLNALKRHYSWLETGAPETGIDAALSVALFGGSFEPGNKDGRPISPPKKQQNDGGCGGGGCGGCGGCGG